MACVHLVLWARYVLCRFESTALSAEGSIKVAEDLSHVVETENRDCSRVF